MTEHGKELARAIARHNALAALRLAVDDMLETSKRDVARARHALLESEALPVREPAGVGR